MFSPAQNHPRPVRRPWWRLLLLLTVALLLPPTAARAAVTDRVEFEEEFLEDRFNVNVNSGDAHYFLANNGLAGTQGLDIVAAGGDDATLVYKSRAYDLSLLTGLDVSIFFRKRAVSDRTSGLAIALHGDSDGRMNAYDDTSKLTDAFAAVRLGRNTGTNRLRLETQTKPGNTATVTNANTGADLSLTDGNWYHLQVSFVRVDATTLRLTGRLLNADSNGTPGAQVATLGPVNLTIPDLAADKQLWVGLRGFDAAGSDAWDNLVVTANTVSTASLPARPTGLTARGTATNAVELSWNDLNSNNTNIVVSRATAPGGPYTDLSPSLPAHAVTFRDAGRSAATRYYYVVRAVNAAGASAFSNEADAVTRATGGVTYYVATNDPAASDTANDGRSLGAPFKTIQKAASEADPGDTVLIRGGVYRESVSLPRSGTETQPITFRAYAPANGVPEVVQLNGLDVITPGIGGIGQWTQAFPGVAGKESIYKIQLTSAWAPVLGRNQVRVGGNTLLVEARWPNVSDPNEFNRGMMAAADAGNINGTVASPYPCTYTDAALAGFPAGFWTSAVIWFTPGQGWVGRSSVVTEHAAGNVLSFNYNSDLSWDRPNNGDPYFLFGRLGGLDAEGECFFDNTGAQGGTANTLYVWKPGGGSPAGQTVEMSKGDGRGVTFTGGRSYFSLENLRFFATVVATGNSSTGCNFENLDFDRCGFDMDYRGGSDQALYLGGTAHRAAGCRIGFVANTGIRVPDSGLGTVIENNVVHDTWDTAISTGKSGDLRVRRNTLFNAGAHGINAHAKRTDFIANHVYFSGRVITDVYNINSHSAGDQEGTRIAYNWAHSNLAALDYTATPVGAGENHRADRGWNGGAGIRLDSGGGPEAGVWNVLIDHNLCWNGTVNQSLITWAVDSRQITLPADLRIRVFNNTVDNDLGLIATNPSGTTATLAGTDYRNNLAVRGLWARNVNLTETGFTLANNVLPAATISPSAPLPDGNLNVNPRYVSPNNRNYALRADSPALDAGDVIDGVTDGHVGDGPDLGALERGLRPFVAGAVLTDADLANLQVSFYRTVTGAPRFVVSGLPMGRSLPLTFRLKIGTANSSSSFFQSYDFNTHTVSATFTAVDTTGMAGPQTVVFVRDGVVFTNLGQTITVPSLRVDAINAPAGNSSGGTTYTLTGAGFHGVGGYLAPVTLSNPQPGDLVTNPVPVRLDLASLITAGRLRADAGDLRFLTADGQTTLDYWIDGPANSANALVWLKAPVPPPGAVDVSTEDASVLYASYGNPTLTGAASLATVFPDLVSPNLKMWLRANTLTLANNAGVSFWSSSSPGGANDAAQTVAANRPTFVTGQLNGLPVVRFDGDNDFLDVGDGLGINSFGFFNAFVNPDPGTTTYQRLYSGYPGTGLDYEAPAIFATIPITGTGAPKASSVAVIQYNGHTATSSDARNFRLGMRSDTPVGHFQGDLAETLAYSPAPDSARQSRVKRYLSRKFATGQPAGSVNLLAATEPFTLSVGGVPATNVRVLGPTQVSFTLPAFANVPAPTPANLTLTSPAGASTTLPNAFYVYTKPVDGWRINQFLLAPGGPTGALAANGADANDNGVPNVMEYALGRDPRATTGALAGMPVRSVETVGGRNYLALTVPKSVTATDATFVVEVSGDMVTWGSTGATTVITNNATTLKVRDNTPMTGTGAAPRRFIRLRVSVP